MRPLLDFYSMAEACLIADVIEINNRLSSSSSSSSSSSNNSLIETIRLAIQQVHTSGILHAAIVGNMSTYVEPSPHLISMLRHLRNAKKRVFLCTNR